MTALLTATFGSLVARCFIDHLVVTAPTLEAGAAYVGEALGVSPQAGGQHPSMGTHNLLVRLGDSMYLEVIAPDPSAPAPTRPRWFALDALGPDAAPSLAAWVARTADIHSTVAGCSESLGEIERMTRGTLAWLITIAADGSPLLHGIAPALIEWETDTHPAAKLRDQGLSLARLELFHPESARVDRLLESLGLEGPVSILPSAGNSRPRLAAHINTPMGVHLLSVPEPFR